MLPVKLVCFFHRVAYVDVVLVEEKGKLELPTYPDYEQLLDNSLEELGLLIESAKWVMQFDGYDVYYAINNYVGYEKLNRYNSSRYKAVKSVVLKEVANICDKTNKIVLKAFDMYIADKLFQIKERDKCRNRSAL